MDWPAWVVTRSYGIAVVLALVFAGVGFVEYATKHIFLNQKLIESNQFESYFRVNSLFFDPNIYGRFLALVMIGLAAVLLWPRRRPRTVGVSAAVLAVLWGALILSFSQSSIAALLVGLAVLAALKYGLRPVIAVGAVVAVIGLVVVLAAPGLIHLNTKSSRSISALMPSRTSNPKARRAPGHRRTL